MSKTDPHHPLERRLFLAILILLGWLPIPLASQRLWGETLLITYLSVVGLIFLAWRWRQQDWSTTPAFERGLPVILAMGGLFIWQMMQLIPLPPELLEALSPRAAEVWTWPPGHVPASWAPLSLDPYETSLKARQTLAWLVLFGLLLLLVRTPEHLRTLALALLMSGGFQAAYGSVLTLGNIDFYPAGENKGVASGTFTNRNHLACYLYLCLSVGIGWLIADTKRGGGASNWRARLRNIASLLLSPKARVRILLCIMVIALVLTRSRMGNTAFFASFSIAGLLALWLQWKHVSRGIIILFVSLMIIDVTIVGTWFGIEKVVDRIEQTTSDSELRVHSFRDTNELLEDFWLTGSGGGSFRTVFPAYQSPEHTKILYHAHNDYQQTMANLGVPGVLLFGFIVLHALITVLRAQRERNHSLMRGMAFATTMSIIGLLIHSTVEFNLQMPAIAGTIVTIFAMGYIAAAMPHRRRRKGTHQVGPLFTEYPESEAPKMPADRPEPGIA